MATTKRPNPAVDASERNAQIAEDMSGLADKTMPAVSTIPAKLKNYAERKRTGANRIKKNNPFLISEGS